MPEPRHILHIGRHKTGTSSLQHFLARNREALKERHGLVYPPSVFGPGHHHLAYHLKPQMADPVSRQRAQEAEAAVREYFEMRDGLGKNGLLLSSEAFQNLPPEAVQKLLPEGGASVICYFREPLDYALSSYCQKVHAQQWTESIEDFVARFSVDYLTFSRAWSKVFGREHFTAGLFERRALAGGDIREDFLVRTGLEDDDFERPETRANPSIGGRLLEVKLALNAMPGDPVELRRRTYQPFAELAERHRPFRQRPRLPEHVASSFLSRHEASLERFREAFGFGDLDFQAKRQENAVDESTPGEDEAVIRAYFEERDPEWLRRELGPVLERVLSGEKSKAGAA